MMSESSEPNSGDQHLASDSQHPTDRSLVRRLQVGSNDAASQLYLKYARRLQSLAKANVARDLSARLDVEDIVQSIFRTFFRRVSRGEYEIPEGEELWGLLLVIGLNKIRAIGEYHRAAKRDVRLTAGDAALDRAVNKEAEGDEVSLSILRMAIEELMEKFSPIHREVLNMRIEGNDIATIAERVGRSKRSVERILQGLLESLAKVIRDEK
ncbi:MAG: sigma-70 family RNA polymerase sigma factor [Planctomycetaceae bacterium]|nr:sigma-70 family RNA polymerase sigma factor [Planctomycetaceae bacterium]